MSRERRHAYLDWVRGLAVLIMIEAHVLDSWTRAADRARPAFGHAMVLGGFGAPLFLFLAGVAVVLSAESKFRRTGNFGASWLAAQLRGWQVFALAFLFRLQSYILSGGFNAIGILKVDILNVMGPAIAVAAIAGRMVRNKTARGVLFAAIACAISLATPNIRATPLLDGLPDAVEWYFRPTPGRTNFTLFPWAGFVFAGAAAGTAIDGLSTAGRERRLHVLLAITGALIVWGAHESSFRPPPFGRSEYWTSSASYFLLRVGLLTLVLPIAFLWERAPFRHKLSSWSPLQEFGRASLFVYWVHVEIVYGFFSGPLRTSLSLEAGLAAYIAFTVFLVGLVRLKNWLVENRAIYLTDNKSVI